MDADQRAPITDSPWFWVMAFASMALLTLVTIGPKYGKRQSALERNYQARERVAEHVARNKSVGELREDELAERQPYATAADTLVPLWPLATIALFVAIFSGIMLNRGQRRGPSNSHEPSSP